MFNSFIENNGWRKKLVETRFFLWFFVGALILLLLYGASVYSYLLFHILAEFFSIIVACIVFVIAWNSRKYADNGFFLFIGTAYLFVAGIDFVHTLTFQGMDIIRGIDTNIPTQLWVGARYLQSIALVVAPFFLKRKIYTPKYLLLFGLVFFLILFLIFSGNFPDAFVEGAGLTSFKISSEYVISFILMTAGVVYVKLRRFFDPNVLAMLLWSLSLNILAEVSFILYFDPTGFFNLIGHFFKVLSFFLIYEAMVVTGITSPQKIIFKQLHESEKKFRDLFDHMSDGFALHKIITVEGDPVDYEFLEVNQAFEKLTGISASQAIGRRVTDIIPGIENDSADWIKRYGDIALNGGNKSFEQKSEAPEKWFSVTAYSPGPGYFATLLEDKTDRKKFEDKLQESEEKYRTLVEASPDGIMFLDDRKKPFFLNSACREQFGLDDGSIETWDYMTCIHEDDQTDFEIALDVALKGKMSTIEIRKIDRNFNVGTYRVRVVPVKSEGAHGVRIFAISRDITEQKKIDNAKTEFISLASHQLKTPLTSAGFAVEILNKKYSNDEESKDLLVDLQDDINFMTDIITRLLGISRIEMGTFIDDPKSTELLPYLNGIVSNLSRMLDKKQQSLIKEFDANLPEYITIDQNILKNVIQNLINNASRYTPINKTITLGAMEKDGRLNISVTDTGPGIPKEIQPKVFTKMYKAFEALDAEGDSSGLGLYIAKLFTERIGGKIRFETEEGVGTTFSISLPILK